MRPYLKNKCRAWRNGSEVKGTWDWIQASTLQLMTVYSSIAKGFKALMCHP